FNYNTKFLKNIHCLAEAVGVILEAEAIVTEAEGVVAAMAGVGEFSADVVAGLAAGFEGAVGDKQTGPRCKSPDGTTTSWFHSRRISITNTLVSVDAIW